MAPQSRKRRAPAEDDEDLATPTQANRNQGLSGYYGDEETGVEGVEEAYDASSGSIAQLSKSFVRYALACEYARIPIKRQDVAQKVLGTHSRQFKAVFDAANSQLLDTFGMELVELPNKEKTTIRQKRAAVAAESQNKSSNQWVLSNALPAAFRTPEVMPPPRIPTSETESAYVGLYTMIISLITLSGGTLSEGKLDRFLKRMNAQTATPIGYTEEVLKRMVKDGYIVKVKDTSGEEVTDYYVGPRGKVEVGEESIANLVRKVYAGSNVQDLEQRLSRSLGITEGNTAHPQPAVGADATPTQSGARRGVGRPRRRREGEDDDY